MRYKKCPRCGANLDYGERCDCEELDQPEIEAAHIHTPHRAEVPRDRPHTQDAYIQRAWRRWYES